MAEKKSQAEQLKEKLFYVKKHATLVMSEQEEKKADKYCEGYKKFLDAGKTEREAAATAVAMAEKAGFKPFDKKAQYKAGDKIYVLNREKAVILAVIGKSDISNGVNLTAAHIDSPRLDLKQNPLYESDELGYFKTHYYGGLRKYQWTAIPLALHGVVVRADGESVRISVGEDAGDPVFYINDLLPHLAAAQSKEPLSSAIKGEDLNLLCGSAPLAGEDDDAIKKHVLKLLHEKYGIIESDFVSAELEIVPATGARDIGFDRALIGSYGHDDRVCAYPALRAILDTDDTTHTQICVLADKEEIGSMGVSGMQSAVFCDLIDELAAALGANPRVCRSASTCLSADVTAAYDPNFASVFEKRNSAIIGDGVAMCKYTGARGKSGSSDASAELVGKIRAILDGAGVVWQTAELGKVDEGGGGTVAMFIANRNIDTLDIGVPVISMHAPFEVVSKVDVYSAYEAFKAFTK